MPPAPVVPLTEPAVMDTLPGVAVVDPVKISMFADPAPTSSNTSEDAVPAVTVMVPAAVISMVPAELRTVSAAERVRAGVVVPGR